jgi:hypothetical protein
MGGVMVKAETSENRPGVAPHQTKADAVQGIEKFEVSDTAQAIIGNINSQRHDA